MDTFLVQPDDKIVYSLSGNGGIDSFVVRRLNADGSQDPAFTEYYGYLGGIALLQTDGRILISDGALVRLNNDGTVDDSFTPDFGSYGTAPAQLSDGRIVTVGYGGLQRLHADGRVDESFAPSANLTSITPVPISHAALLPGGKVLIAGKFNYIGERQRHQLAVLNSDGTLDESFDAGELLTTRYSQPDVYGAVAQPEGKVVVYFADSVVRLNADGSRDETFRYTSSGRADVYPRTLMLQPDGKILLNGDDGFIRLLPDGSHDPSFTNGTGERSYPLFVEPDGKIMVAGSWRLATRLFPDGSIDSSFGGVGGMPTYDYVSAMARQPDGMYLVSRPDTGRTKTQLFFRMFEDGTRDPSFSANFAWVRSIIVDAAGITFSGDLRPSPVWGIGSGPSRPGLTRLNFDGTRDSSFREVLFDVQASANFPAATAGRLLRQDDGNLIVFGSFRAVDGVERNGIARVIGGQPKHLANISTRVRVGTGEAAAIGGFIVVGETPKKVIVRALGPSLSSSGLSASKLAADPTLELLDSSGAVIATNNSWREAEAEVNATGIPPRDDAESAIVATLEPGSYTAVVHDARGAGGLALVEIYDLNPATGSELANISTRGHVQRGDNVMIGGFIVRGSEPSAVVVRAIGPSLASSGVINPLPDPSLSVHDADGNVVAANEDWKQRQQSELEAIQMAGSHDSEAAVIAELAAGSYTAVVSGGAGTTGVGLVEVYRLDSASR